MTREYYLYILECADGSFYTGITRDIQRRVYAHQQGFDRRAYTYRRRPVKLVWAQVFDRLDDAFQREQQIKGWSHAKKAALIRDDFEAIHRIVKAERKRRESKDPSRRAEAK